LDIFGDTLTTQQQPVINGNSFDSIFSTQPYENGGGHSIIETIKDNHLQYVSIIIFNLTFIIIFLLI
jgi:hypothetical protein